MIKILIYLVIGLIGIIAILGGATTYYLNKKIGGTEEIIVSLPSNSSISSVTKLMHKNGILKPSFLFKPFLKLYSIALNEKLYIGTYKFSPDNTNLDVVRAIFTGKQRFIVKLTYPEGISLKDFASITAKNLGIDSLEFIRYAKSDSLLKANKIPGKSVEGYLMPETYFFYWKFPVKEVINKLLSQQLEEWNKRFKEKVKSSPMTKHEILTLASIVEAESPVRSERPVIAGLYLNRLKINMKLDADPTVSYALGGKRKLSLKDLETESPYNTYRNHGLPPGPINSPSLSSIEAVLNANDNSYLYFVAVGDGSGRHNFSRNYTQHLQNVAKYKKNR